MKIIDLYIFKRFLKTYLFVIAMIVLVICVIDYTEKVDNFIKTKPPGSSLFFDYYINLAIYWANYVSPLMIFIATVFMTANMAARTEIIAMLSTGMSFIRLLVPYTVAATLVGVVTFLVIGWLLPRANKVRIAFESKYVKDKFYNSDRDIHIGIAPNTYAYLESYSVLDKTGYRFTLERIDGTQLKEKLTSDRIAWDSLAKKWTIYECKIRTILANNHEKLTFRAKIDTTLNLNPKDFESTYQLHETFTLPQLTNHITLLKSRGSDGKEVYLVEKYVRYASPFSVIILTLIGVILSARKARGGVGLQIALGFILAFVYIIFFVLSKGLAQAGNLPPLFAVWLPNIVFGSIGLVLYYTVPR